MTDTVPSPDRPMKFAYADPPYFKCCALYGHRHEDPYGCWNKIENHLLLIENLVADYPDGWALSMSSNSLRLLLPSCPERTRVGSWIKPMCAGRPGIFPTYTWEPIVFYGGRKLPKGEAWARDSIVANAVRDPLVGRKPSEVCRAIANMLGWRESDELVDIFPGSGVMGRVLAQGRLL